MSTGAQDNLSGGTFEVIVQDPSTPSQSLGITATGEAKVSVTQPLPVGTNSIGQVTANAGTNLNTSLLALDSTVAKDSSLGTINTSVNTLLKPASTLSAVTTLGSITSALPSGTNLLGKVGIDQTTPGTTNGVQINAALPAGAAIIGNVRIDQTTPGTTNAVQANAGTNLNTSALALSATQTNGNQKTQVVDGAGAVVGPVQTLSGTNYVPVVLAASSTPGAAVVARSVQVAGSDGTNAQTLSVDTTGKLNINNISGTITLPTLAATSTKQSDGTQKSQTVDGSGNVQPSGDVLTRKIFVQPTDGSNNQGYTASSEAKVLVTPLTNSSVVKAQLQDNAGTAITLGQKTMASSVPVVLSSDQTGINSFLDKSGTGTISALNGAVTITTNGMSTIAFSAQGTFVATLQVQGQAGDAAWDAVLGYLPGVGTTSTVLTGPSMLVFPVGGYSQVRLIAIAYTSGTANIQYNLGSGTQGAQVFNLTPASLQATVTGSGSAGSPASGVVSIQGVASGTVVPGNITQLAGNAINTGAGATGTGTARVASNLYDGSGTAITSTAVAGAAVSKQPLDTSIVAPAILYYSAPVEVHQTATTATAATVWAMRNAAASTRTVYVERIQLSVDFSGTNPVTRSLLGYDLCRFSTATPTAGAAITVIKMDNSGNPATQVTDVRDLDTGLTTTSVVFETAFATVAVGSTDGATREYTREGISLKLAPGEGLCLRLTNTAVVGLNISGEIVWSER